MNRTVRFFLIFTAIIVSLVAWIPAGIYTAETILGHPCNPETHTGGMVSAWFVGFTVTVFASLLNADH